MLVLRRISSLNTLNYCKEAWRCCSSVCEQIERPSAREREWRQDQKRYQNYPNILYSSYLENQVEHMSYRRLKSYAYKKEKEERRKHNDNRGHIWQPVEKLVESAQYPEDWMEDYEFYEGTVEINDGGSQATKLFGTADENVPASSVPCSGCGAHLHCKRSTLPGYIPKEIFHERTNKELQTIICQRCHFLKNYNIALDLEVTADSYVQTISRIQNEFALAIVMVDLLDFPCSIWPGMQQLLGSKRPVFVVGNKVDLLPRDCNSYLEHVKQCLKHEMVKSGFDALNIKNVSLISAKTGYGIEELITQLHKIWLYKGDVYLLGCTNVGKSSLFNILLNSDYCRPEAANLVRRATICPWPGTTLQMLRFPILRPSEIRVYHRFRRLFSERSQKATAEKLRRDQARKTGAVQAAQPMGIVGRTFAQYNETNDAFAMSGGTQPIMSLNERSLEYQKAKWCYDTPGVMHPEQITNLLTSSELTQLAPNCMISPRALRLKPGMSLLLAGLGRLDFLNFAQVSEEKADWIKALIFSAMSLPIVVTPTVQADDVYAKYVGSEILGLPTGSEARLARWPGLKCKPNDLELEGSHEEGLSCDVTLSSAGWIGLSLPYGSVCTFRAWTPYARGIYVRTPALTPYAERLVGKRIRNSLAYNVSKPFVFRK